MSALAQAKIDLLNKNAAKTGDEFISRRASAPGIILSDQTNDLTQRLKAIMDGKAADEENASQIIDRMKSLRGDLQNTLSSCHKTLEVSSACLAEHFRAISTKKLTTEIKERFAHFDKDQSGSLDREEVREAMAEMGTRPTDEELEEFYVQCDLDGNGLIDLVEFENMVRVKLGLMQATDLKESIAFAKQQNARITRRASTSATQDPWLIRAAEQAGLGPRARRSSMSGAIESIPEIPVKSPPSRGSAKTSPTAAVTGMSEEAITRLPSIGKAGGSPTSRTGSGVSRTASAGAAIRPSRPAREPLVTRTRSSKSPEPRADADSFSRRSSTGKSTTVIGATRMRSAAK